MESFTINSKTDQLPLSVIVSCSKQPKAIVQIVHGMCEHKERYLDFIKYLNENGFGVIIHDKRGHGASILNKDDLGYFYQKNSQVLIDDVYQLTCYIKNRYPDLPIFLFGHSMGSLVVRNYLRFYSQAIDGLIVCGSPSKNKLAIFGKMICSIIAKFKGDHYRSKLMHYMSLGMFNHGFDKPNEWICSDSNVVDQYNSNPLCNFNFTVNGYYNLLDLMINTYKNFDYHIKADLPILFISGNEDPCLVNQKSFYQAVNHLKNQGYYNVEAKLYEKMRHEILNEKNKKLVYHDIVTYLNQQLEKRGKL